MAIFIFTIATLWGRTILETLHLQANCKPVRFHTFTVGPAPPLPRGVLPRRRRAGAHAYTNTRLRYYLCDAKCNQLVSSLPGELAGSRCCASEPGTSRTPWPELCDEEGTFGPLVAYTSPVNVFYFYLLGV